ncbi:iron ABC transporter permease [Frankia sp. CcI156]|uniref:Binding-protein-dependent transport systems inner membrane component n=1 Tax=Frankia casuarinae (strain DSM 45818 / CECT 9043 / HFP020203 / CcI3) TaxID=106370 RepID=Q2JCM5_FRACC|nr:binding-protein-dependent transport systems inner membrane component [Frankia casuarinae]ONH28620.1 iron ABC transporter permease [Frankia sp. CcI156]TFE30505.1 iron ABC transporter permease [Frankia sp. B2]
MNGQPTTAGWWVRTGPAYPRPLLLACVLVALLAAVPLFFVVGYTVSVGWSEAWRLLIRPRVGELLVNTTKLVTGGMAASAVLGTAAAWLVERTALPGRRVWHVLLAAPLALPAFVVSYGWVSLTADVEGYPGALLIVTLAYYPLVYLPVGATLRGLDPALEESARSLGLGPWRTFTRVVLPQLRPAVLGGSLLVGLHLLAEFGALQMLRFPTFTTAIYDQYRSSFNGPAANMLAGVLVLYCAVLVGTELSLRGRHRYARLGPGASRTAQPARLGRLTAPAVGGLGAVVGLALGVPLVSLVRWLLVGASAAFPAVELATAAATAAGLGLAGALCTVLLALPVAWLAVRHPGRIGTLLERSTYTANALPGIVVALALVTVSLHILPAVYQTTTLLIAAYAIMFLPRATVAVRGAIAQAPPVLDDVAHALGLRPTRAWLRVTLPLIAPGVGAGAILVFLAVVTELTATLLLSPTGTDTLATEFWSNVRDVDYGAAAPYAGLMVLLSTPATFLLTRSARRST